MEHIGVYIEGTFGEQARRTFLSKLTDTCLAIASEPGIGLRDHGYDAPLIAAQRRDKLLADGDLNGLIIWKRIMAAMDELTRVRGDGERLN